MNLYVFVEFSIRQKFNWNYPWISPAKASNFPFHEIQLNRKCHSFHLNIQKLNSYDSSHQVSSPETRRRQLSRAAFCWNVSEMFRPLSNTSNRSTNGMMTMTIWWKWYQYSIHRSTIRPMKWYSMLKSSMWMLKLVAHRYPHQHQHRNPHSHLLPNVDRPGQRKRQNLRRNAKSNNLRWSATMEAVNKYFRLLKLWCSTADTITIGANVDCTNAICAKKFSFHYPI